MEPKNWERRMAAPLARRRFLLATGSVGLAGLITACTGGGDDPEDTSTTASATESTSNGAVASNVQRPDGWTEVSHSNNVDPDLATVFPDDRVNQLTLRMTPDQWTAMLENMTELYGERGAEGEGVGPGGGFPRNGELPEGGLPEGQIPEDGMFPPADGEGGMGRGGFGGSGENPMWIPATIEFNGLTWTNVGVRFKGNSSLMSGWRSGSDKLPLKFDFDQFESDYPEIDNQRFYGFKQLSLSNNFGDETQGMRETIAYDLFEDAGLVASKTAAYEIVLDRGEGPVSLGLYTVIEVTDDTVVSRFFGSDDGNIYEGDGPAASLAAGTLDQIPDSFQKENNEDAEDWSDIEALYAVLHSAERTSNPEAWRSALEDVFEVDSFFEWLGVAAVLQHWDTYGGMTHNFYLYHDPESDHLIWISWDHNLILGASFGGGMGGGGALPLLDDAANGDGSNDQAPQGRGQFGGGGFGRGGTSLDRSDIGENWPLIRYLMDDPTYYERYIDYLRGTATLFVADTLEAAVRDRAELLAAHVEDATAFEAAVETLITAIRQQESALAEFLA